MQLDEQAVDKDLHSRTIAALGEEMVRAIASSNVLVSGLNGLGCEVAKNVLLGGVRSLTLHDTKPATLWDLSSQYYIAEADVGTNRAKACLSKLQELNTAVQVKCITDPLDTAHLKDCSILIMIDATLEDCLKYNAFCRAQSPPIKFIRVDVRGVFGQVFTDFGPAFVVNDTTGENPHSGIVAHITNSNPAVVTVPNDDQVEFGDGEYVTFKGVPGMTEMNNREPIKILETHMYNFKIDIDTTNFGKYEQKNLSSYGTVIEAKIPKKLEFKSLADNLSNPDFSRDPTGNYGVTDFDKFGRSELLHLAFLALDEYRQQKGDLPPVQDAEAAAEVVKLANELKAKHGMELEVDETIVKALARTSRAVLSPMCSIFGGIVGQEVAKAVSNKHHPVYQFLYLDASEALPDYEATPASEYQTSGQSRYDANVAVFGKTVQDKLFGLKSFMVGCGALGCELFKNFAMLGAACGNGMITVTDDDVIEKSNLSRQFLFRNYNVGQPKSVAATNAIQQMNNAIKVDRRQDRVSPATENVYNDAFWEGLDVVVNALDNVKARHYVDSRCVFFSKPLLESGTMGTKCNVQCVIPHKTISYGARKDPETKEAPECALHNFPHTINHCLSLARSEFVGIFDSKASEAANYLTNPNYVAEMSAKIWKEDGSEQPDAAGKAKEANEILDGLLDTLVDGKVKTFEECVVWARLRFEEYFSNKIRQLTFSCPRDMVNASGAPFWSPPKRFPEPIAFNKDEPEHMAFIIAAANLKAQLYNVPGYKEERSPSFFKPLLDSVLVPEFQPQSGVKIDTGEKKEGGAPEAPAEPEASVIEQVKQKLSKLPQPSAMAGTKITAMEFEKDDDTNFHMDYISSFANLRARNYSIEEVEKLQARLIAGRIIPALATTTSMVTGFVCIELIKYLHKGGEGVHRDLQANLAISMFISIDPEGPPKNKPRTIKKKPDPVNHPEYEEEETIATIPTDGFTLWDKIVIAEGDLTVQELVDWWKKTHNATCSAISVQIGDAAMAFYNMYMPATKKNLPLKMSEVYKRYDPEFTGTYFCPACSLQNEDMDDVETPTVIFKFA